MLAWMDLEMTGLDPARHVIVEIATLLTDDELRPSPRARTSSSTRPPTSSKAMDDVVRSHAHSIRAPDGDRVIDRSRSPRPATQTLGLPRHSHPASRDRCRSAATRSGRTGAFSQHTCPTIENFLHYRSIDVSTVKELCRRWYPDVLAGAPPKREAHRALDDIRESIAELAYYRSTIFIGRDQPSISAVARRVELAHPRGHGDGGAARAAARRPRIATHQHHAPSRSRRPSPR